MIMWSKDGTLKLSTSRIPGRREIVLRSGLLMISGVLVVALPSCQSFVPAPLDAGASASAFGSRSLNDASLHSYLVSTGRAPRGESWTLHPLEGAAEYYHPDVAVARAKANTALAAIDTADTAPNPGLSLAPELGKASQGTSPWILGFSLDITVETAGKRGLRAEQARLSANSAALAVSDALWTARSGARAALLEREAALQRSALLQDQAALYTTAVDSLQARVTAGDLPRADLLQTQSLQSRVLLDLADARRTADASAAKLAAALGIPASALDPARISYGSLDQVPEVPATSRLRSAALTQRPDLLAALQDYAAADTGLKLEIAKQYPDIHFGPGYTFDQGQNKWALGVGFTLPTDGNRGPIREASAKRAEAAATFLQAQANASGQLDQALSAVKSDRARLTDVSTLLGRRESEVAAAERLTASGEAEKGASVLLKIQLAQDRITRLDALVQLQQSLGQLEDSTRIPIIP